MMYRTLTLPAFILLLAAACGGDGPSNSAPPQRTVASIEVGPPTPVVEDGGEIQLNATVRDQSGAVFQSLPAGTTITWTSLQPDIATVDGTGRVTGEKPGQAMIRAAIGQVQGERQVSVTARATALERVDGDDQQAPAGSVLPGELVVRALDRHGQPVAGVTVQFVVTAGGGAVAPASVATGADGLARAAWTLGTAAGAQAMEARAEGLAGSPVAFGSTAVAGPPATIERAAGDEQQGSAGAQLPAPVVAKVTDAHGNPVSGANVTWAVASGGGSVAPSSSMTDAEGLASTTWTLGAAGTNTVIAAAGGQETTFSAMAQATVINCAQQVTFGDGAQIQGDLPTVRITGNVTVSGTTNICGSLTIEGAAARLTLAGNEVTVAGNFTRSEGQLTMTNSADRLTVNGNVSLTGGSTQGHLTAGVFRVRGSFSTATTHTAFVSTGTEVRFDGSAVQTVSLNGSQAAANTSRFHRLVIDNAAGVTFGVFAAADEDLQVAANAKVTLNANVTLFVNGEVTSGSGSSIAGPGTLSVAGPLNVGGSYGAGTTVIRGPGHSIPVLTYGNLTVNGTAVLSGNTTLTGNLTISGAGAQLTLGGRELMVGGNLTREHGGQLTMTNAADRLTVNGNVSLFGGSTQGHLTAGVFRVRGSFTTTTTQTAFVSTGTEVRFDGSTVQVVALNGSQAAANTSRFHRLGIENPAGVTFGVFAAVDEDLQVAADAKVTLNANVTLSAAGTVTSGSGSSIAGPGTLSVAGALNVGGSYDAGTTVFRGAGQSIPVLPYGNLSVNGTATLSGNTTLTGNLTISGAGAQLTLGGRELTVGGTLTREHDGQLTMTNAADRLTVNGSVNLFGGSTQGHLTAGILRVRGGFTTAITQTAFVSTGTEVRFDGSTAQVVSLNGSQAAAGTSRFHRVVVENSAGVSFNAHAHVSEQLDLVGSMTVQPNVTIGSLQMLILRGSAVLNNNGTIQTAACTKEAGHTITGTDPCPG